MNRINYTRTGGLPVDQEGLDFMQQAYTSAIAAIAKCYGNKVIVTGMEVGGSTVAEGWFVYNGELIKFNSCNIATHVKITEESTSVIFEDGLNKSTYYEKAGVCDIAGDFLFTDLVRIQPFTQLEKMQLDRTWLRYDVKEVDCPTEYIGDNFDSTGLGINEREGWAICNGNNGTKDRRGLISIAYDGRTANPSNGIWDVLYNTMGATGGSKLKQILQTNLPAEVTGKFYPGDYNNDTTPGNQLMHIKPKNNASTDSHLQDGAYKLGDGTALDIRNPFIVTLFIQKL